MDTPTAVSQRKGEVVAALRYFVLGPVQALDQNRVNVPLARAKQRTVLTLLLLNRGKPVTIERMVDALWEDDPPASARKNVHTYVWRLRQSLGGAEPGPLVASGSSYQLNAAPDEVDLDVFETLTLQSGRLRAQGNPHAALSAMRKALDLWRDEPFGNVPLSMTLAAARDRLVERRLMLLEDYVETSLACGLAASVIPELQRFVREHPWRERFTAQLMRALHQTGRRGDALAVYQRTRGLLSHELGVDPGLELRRTHQRILVEDVRDTELRYPDYVA
jgi:DNA-binding SARP family transcriptional activator